MEWFNLGCSSQDDTLLVAVVFETRNAKSELVQPHMLVVLLQCQASIRPTGTARAPAMGTSGMVKRPPPQQLVLRRGEFDNLEAL